MFTGNIYNFQVTFLIYLSADLTTDPIGPPPVFFHGSAGSSVVDVQRTGYGSLSDTPSIISMPPSLSPPPCAMSFPPLFLSSHSLRTISARDLEKSCIWYWDFWMTVKNEVVIWMCTLFFDTYTHNNFCGQMALHIQLTVGTTVGKCRRMNFFSNIWW